MSSSDDASRLSKALDGLLGGGSSDGSGTAVPPEPPHDDWSIDDDPVDEPAETVADPADTPPPSSQAAPSPADDLPPAGDPASDEILDVHDLDVPDADRADPAATYELPEIVPATSDARSDDASDTADADVPAEQPERVRIVPGVTDVTPAAAVAAPAAPAPARAPAVPAPAVPSAVPAAAVAPATAAPSARPTGWSDHVAAPATGTRSPSRRPRVRRVTRVLRHIDPWSTFKLALLFSLVAYLTALTSGVLLWRVADTTGALDNVERWFTQFGWETFEFKGGEIFHNAWIIGLFGVVFATGGAVLLATLFNLVSDIIGGIRLTVLEEEVVERTVSSTRRYVVRRPGTVPDGEGANATWNLDDDASESPPEPAAASTNGEHTAPAAPPPTSASDWSIDDDEPAAGTRSG